MADVNLYTNFYLYARQLQLGHTIWEFEGRSWQIHSLLATGAGVPGPPPTDPGKFIGQLRSTPCVLPEGVSSVAEHKTETQAALSWQAWRAAQIQGYMSIAELEFIVHLASSLAEPAVWAEVGTLCGRSFLATALSLPKNSTLITVDLELGLQTRAGQSFFSTYQEAAKERPDLKFVLIRADSIEAAGLVPPRSCDVVFIDGSHDREHFRGDVAVWTSRIVNGGLLCGHDYGNSDFPGIKDVVDAMSGASVAVDMIWKQAIQRP